jgi:hypothetical protein
MPFEQIPEAPVDIGRLEFDEDLALLEGVPFNGIIRSEYEDGTLGFLGRYRDGLPEGLNEEWYPNGQLFHRWLAVWGNGVSEAWVWYPNGILRSYRKYGENRSPLERRAWDSTGAELDPSQLLPINRADVLTELFDHAMALKRASETGGVSSDTKGGVS